MTKNKIGLLACALAFSVACGDSTGSTDDTTTGGEGTGGTNNAASTTGGGTTPTGGGNTTGGGNSPTGGGNSTGGEGASAGTNTTGDDNGEGGVPTTGACTNASDVAVLMSFDPGMTASGCGMSCLADDTCQDCYDKDANFSKVTPACRTCWVKITRCVADKCVLGGGGACLTDANGQACADCRTTNCNAEFTTCSGMDPSMM